MNLTTKNFKLHCWLLSSIWSRRPIIITASKIQQANLLLDDLLAFIPRYSQIIACGNVPPRISMLQRKPKIFDMEDYQALTDSILMSYKEDKNGHSVPLQLLCFDITPNIFNDILKQIDYGWIALTELPTATLRSFFPEDPFEIHPLNGCSIIFLKGHPKRIPIESRLMKIYMIRSEFAANYLIQKKVADIRSVAEILIDEIESGRKFHQAEIQELFKIDSYDFNKCLEIIEVEFNVDINRYIQRISNKMKRIHRKIMESDGILYVCTLRNNQLIGLTKSNEAVICPVRALSESLSVFKKITTVYEAGTLGRMIIELKRKTKLIIITLTDAKVKEPLIFGFFLKADIPVAPFLRTVEQILNSEMGI